MPAPTPLIDKRSFDDLVAQTERLLQRYSGYSDWQQVQPIPAVLTGRTLNEDIADPAAGGELIAVKGTYVNKTLAERISQIAGLDLVKVVPVPATGWALVRIFARLAELGIDRLNQVPDKNFLAFLDLLGLELLPPQAARVPLTFQLASGSTTDALVPARTSVAALPAEGETEPVIFETERDLVVTCSQLVAAFTREPGRDLYSNHSAIVSPEKEGRFSVFQGSLPITHCLYLGHKDLFGIEVDKDITLRFSPAEGNAPWLSAVTWSSREGMLPATLSSAPVDGCWVVTLFNVPRISDSTVGGRTSAWLRGLLATSLPRGEWPLPRINTIQTSVHLKGTGILADLAFANQLSIDLTKDFFPFGEKPKFNDTFYLANDEAFYKPHAKITEPPDNTVTLMVELTNPSNEAGTPLPAKSENVKLEWEFWNSQTGQWELLGESGPGVQPKRGPYNFSDGTNAFLQKGPVVFSCPPDLGPKEYNGQLKRWIRVRIGGGNYGVEAHYEPVKDQEGRVVTDPNTHLPIYQLVPTNFRPPSIKRITLSYEFTSDLTAPDFVLTENDFAIVDPNLPPRPAGQTFYPYTPTADAQTTFYLGFARPGAFIGFDNRSVALFFGVAEVQYGEAPAGGRAVAEPPAVLWEYWNGSGWARLGARDETQGFTRSGLVTFIGPPDFRASTEFGQQDPGFWLRARLDHGGYDVWPKLRRVLTNTMWAAHTLTLQNEILGSSIGKGGQVFRTSHVPVLPVQRIEVREPESPSAAELAILKTEEGEDPITTVLDPSGRPLEVWVRWHQVPDFYESGPRSRHYTLDRLTGDVGFGDNQRGLVPPQGRSNLRAAWYQTGGGPQGNRPAGTIIQLKHAVPYVDRVTNWEASSGGAAQETLESVKSRGPKTLRHRTRAVAIIDFEDLAIQASTEVARVKGIPAQGSEDAGRVGLLIVPRSTTPQPIPSLELVGRVEDYIRARLTPTVDLWVAGPDWLRVTVTAEIVPVSLEKATDVQTAVLACLAAFLHPLTGGLDGKGWDFGRKPYRSDLYALVERTPGVDHLRHLTVAEEGEPKPDRFLVYAGDHQITMVSEPVD